MSRLRELRKERGYTQIKMQMLTGIDQSAYSKIERGERYLSFEQCRRVALALDTSKVDCDYYNFLRGDRSAFNSYRGEYMTQYSWAEVTRSALRQQAAAMPKSGSIPSYYVPPTGF